ncbi:chaperone protein dnaJ 13-like [Zingiber officinale]|uniref:chaperone protein dnaJ 13-like n=1 Tax=Zingiber officinale TaxID=94328 RepID=UPI001C4D3AF9|nr:chaperone protein dnaJ 13-like [Zingiber officinale]
MGSRSTGGRAAEEEVPNTELYARLQVSPSASAEEIRKAFLYWSGVAHPDKHLDPQLKDVATENFRQIVEAYDILNDPDKRQIYDIYGMEGLSSGLELGPHLNKVDELKEELEKLKRHKEHEKALAHSGASVMLLGRLSLPDYLEGGRIINRMEMASDFQSQISKRNIVSVNGRFVVSGESGQGSATVVFRHYVSPATEVDFRATAGLRSLIGFQASRQLSNHSTASSGFMVSLGDGSVNLSNTWGRQLSETSSGNIQLVLGTKSAISVGWQKKEKKVTAAGAIKLGIGLSEASAQYTRHLSEKSHCLVAGYLGSTLDFEIGGGRRLSNSSTVRAIYNVGIEGVSWRFELHRRRNEKIVIPVLLTRELNLLVTTGALLIPSSIYFLLKKFVLKPYYRRQEQKKAIKEKEESLDQIRKARDAAKNAQKLLENASNRKKTKELEKDGLVITKAMYGKIDTTNENDYLEAIDDAASLVLDVTLPLNFLVTNSQLKLHKGIKKSGLMGFCDPCPGEPKQLLVEYTYKGDKYKVLVGDYDLLQIPQYRHKV